MSQKKLRLSKSLLEVQNALVKMPAQSEVSLWYLVGSERTVFTAIFLRADPAQRKILFQLKTPTPDLSTQSLCYFKLFETEGVSKCKIVQILENVLVLDYPSEMIMSEKRKDNRAQFNREQAKTVTLQFGTEQKEFEVLNASIKGLALNVTPAHRDLFRDHTEVKVIKLNEHILESSSAGVVLHESGTSCGLNLKTEIPKAVFDQFIFVERPIEVNLDKLSVDQEYRSAIRSNMKLVAKRLEKKPKLALAMKSLTIPRDGSNYLKNHIELLCECTCTIGRMLGWVTEGAIEKLIYVSYLHDIRYFEHQNLARISSLEQFNQLKDSLSAAEQKIYLEGPAYSAMLASEDEFTSPDVEKILIQQKERSDGSGFPAGVRSDQLAPLSCLFILCHEFVDYVIDDPKWSFKEFVLTNRPIFKGPYFLKIFQVFSELDAEKK